MFVALPGIVGPGGGGPSYPPYGTLLSSHCGGFSAQDAGPETYVDAQGTSWYGGMYTLWQQIADGTGGSFWQTLGSNASDAYSACWLPSGFCISSSTGDLYLDWNGCGGSGNFGPIGNYYSYVYADGSGGTYNDGGNNYSDPPTSGTIIYASGESDCCKVIYDGSGGYYISDECGGGGCPEYGSFLYDGCTATDGVDASGAYFSGSWTYGQYLADGSCGSYFSPIGDNQNGCYYPNGWKFDYSSSSSSLHWTVQDSGAMTQAEGDATYAESWYSDNIANGSGGTYSDSGAWSLSSGDLIASGTYYDANYNQDWYYEVYYDGMGGFYTNQYPAA